MVPTLIPRKLALTMGALCMATEMEYYQDDQNGAGSMLDNKYFNTSSEPGKARQFDTESRRKTLLEINIHHDQQLNTYTRLILEIKSRRQEQSERRGARAGSTPHPFLGPKHGSCKGYSFIRSSSLCDLLYLQVTFYLGSRSTWPQILRLRAAHTLISTFVTPSVFMMSTDPSMTPPEP